MGVGALAAIHQARVAPDGNDFPAVGTDQIVGRYHLQVGTIPAVIQMGHGHLAIDVRTAAQLPSASGAVSWRAGRGPGGLRREQAVPNVRVRLSAVGPGGLSTGPFEARNSAREPQYYDAALDLPRPGLWHVAVAVTGPLGRAQTELSLTVVPPQPAWESIAEWWVWLLAGLAVLLLNHAEWRRTNA